MNQLNALSNCVEYDGGEQHLQRYLDEFSFRYSNRAGVGVDDAERASRALKGITGKRLTYRRPH